MPSFPFIHQIDSMDCGPSSLRMICKYYGKNYSHSFLNEFAGFGKQGVSLAGISSAADKIGFKTMSVKIKLEILLTEKPYPCILHWRQNHFVVLFKSTKKHIWVADPAAGIIKYTHEELTKYWSDGKEEGIALLLEPRPEFYSPHEEEKSDKIGFGFFLRYLIPHKKLIIQLFIGLIAGSLLSLILPFLTQSLVDIGVSQNNLNYVYIILIAQVMLFVGTLSVNVIRSWILLHMSTRLNIAIISDFIYKLTLLPIAFFDSRNLGDTLQRIRDHDRIRHFLTSGSIQTIFSFVNIFIFGIVLWLYSFTIFGIFFLGSLFYIGWIFLFLKKRKEIDYKRFQEMSASQSNEVQLVQGMQEIKLNGAEQSKRWEWESIQIRLFNVSIKNLTIEQYQSAGGAFINELKNILILFWSAKSVIEGDMTLGMMLAATQITGQLNYPISQLIGFVQQAQDASISLERIGEIHNETDEDARTLAVKTEDFKKDIVLENVSFKYKSDSPLVLKNITLTIPYGKTTAIVGTSGSGKTTLLKLLLKFYQPTEGQIRIGEENLSNISSSEWRKKCGVVMQEGFIFSNSIIHNIAISDDEPDIQKFNEAVRISSMNGFVDQLPLNYQTEIGANGIGLSTGQKQRIMIARAIYKNPDFLLFDEATSSLDTKNEKIITENLQTFGKERTAIIIAHRLSTVKNADNIVVLENGKIEEVGSHIFLLQKKGIYFDLIKNQLELNT